MCTGDLPDSPVVETVLPLWRVQVWSLVKELGFCMLCSAGKKNALACLRHLSPLNFWGTYFVCLHQFCMFPTFWPLTVKENEDNSWELGALPKGKQNMAFGASICYFKPCWILHSILICLILLLCFNSKVYFHFPHIEGKLTIQEDADVYLSFLCYTSETFEHSRVSVWAQPMLLMSISLCLLAFCFSLLSLLTTFEPLCCLFTWKQWWKSKNLMFTCIRLSKSGHTQPPVR